MAADCLGAVGWPVCPAAQALLPVATQQALACSGEEWQRSLLQKLEQLYNEAQPNGTRTHPLQSAEPKGHRRFDITLPVPSRACKLETYGKGDGAKRLCGLKRLPADQCTVLSIGSRGDIRFELDLIHRTNCSVEIFDCTVSRCGRRARWPAEMRTGRVRYHSVCIDAQDRTEDSSLIRTDWKHRGAAGKFAFRTYEAILAKRQITGVAAMKMDIEGFEYVVLGAMLRTRSAALPAQIAFELHWQTQMTSLSWHHRAKTAGEIALLSRALYDAGYRALSRADNTRCPHCSEFTVVRLFCPPPLQPLGAASPAAANDAATTADDDPGWGHADPGSAEGCSSTPGEAPKK